MISPRCTDEVVIEKQRGMKVTLNRGRGQITRQYRGGGGGRKARTGWALLGRLPWTPPAGSIAPALLRQDKERKQGGGHENFGRAS